MTSEPVPQALSADLADKFPVFPPRDDMQNPIYLHDQGYQAALRRHFGAPDTTIVLGEVPVGWRPSQVRGLLKPDLLVAFSINRAGVIARDGYSIDEQDKPPDFVLEVASKTTGRNDYTTKREGYANYGVPEYWRFDPTGGRYHQDRLAGDRLVDGAYVPIAINKVDDDHYWGHSAVLGLDLCWEYGRLRWYDPAAQRYLRTYDDTDDDRIAAETRAATAETELDTERQARAAAETELDAERQARAAAEAQARQLEAQLRAARGGQSP